MYQLAKRAHNGTINTDDDWDWQYRFGVSAPRDADRLMARRKIPSLAVAAVRVVSAALALSESARTTGAEAEASAASSLNCAAEPIEAVARGKAT